MVVERQRLYILQIRNIPSGKRMLTFLVLGNDKHAWLNCSSQTPRKCFRHYSCKNSQCCSVLYCPLHCDTSVVGRVNWNSSRQIQSEISFSCSPTLCQSIKQNKTPQHKCYSKQEAMVRNRFTQS